MSATRILHTLFIALGLSVLLTACARESSATPAKSSAMDDPKAKEIQQRYDYATRYMNSADYTKFVREQVEEQRQVIEALGLGKKS